jgi:hypothetical protein
VVAERPQLAGLRPRRLPRFGQGVVEVERLGPFALLAGLEEAISDQ